MPVVKPSGLLGCCPPGSIQCPSCWRKGFARCMRARVAVSELHELHKFCAGMRNTELARVITGNDFPAALRHYILGMTDNAETVDAVRDAMHKWHSRRAERVARAQIYVNLCDYASNKSAAARQSTQQPVRSGSLLAYVGSQ